MFSPFHLPGVRFAASMDPGGQEAGGLLGQTPRVGEKRGHRLFSRGPYDRGNVVFSVVRCKFGLPCEVTSPDHRRARLLWRGVLEAKLAAHLNLFRFPDREIRRL